MTNPRKKKPIPRSMVASALTLQSMKTLPPKYQTKVKKKKNGDDDEDFGPKFKVIIDKAEPAGVKVSKKNCCTVEIKDGYIDEVLEEEQINLINYYVAQKQKNSWKD